MVASSTNVNLVAVDFDPFAGPDIVRLAPSTEPQLEIWTACQFGGDDANRAYNESVSLRFDGDLDKRALEQALAGLMHRHEALRSAFSADGKQICVFKDLFIPLDYQDCSGKTEAEKEQIVQAYVKQDALHVFDLINGPLWKVGLIKLSETKHHFTFTGHHIVCDGWSLGVILQDLSALYSACVLGAMPDLPEAPLYSQFAFEELTFAKSRDYQQIEQFWLDQYKGAVPVLNLSTDFPRPRLRNYAGNRLDFPLDDALILAVRKMGIKAGCSFVTTLLAAFEVLLRQLTRQDDIVVGLPAAGQSATDKPGLVGHCVNLLPLRSNPTDSQRFIDFLKERKNGLLDALEHQRLTFGHLLKKLAIVRDPSRMPLVPVVFNVDIGLDNGVSFHDLTYKLISNPRSFENFELSLNATGSEQSMVMEWSYNAKLFKAETIQGIHQQFERLLWSLVDSPEQTIGDVQLGHTTQAEEEQVTTPWNDTDVDFPSHKSLHSLISETAQAYPNNTAVRYGDNTLTYRALNEKANQFAELLLAKGVQPGDKVGLAVDRSLELIVSMLAIMKTGAAYIPVDPQHPTERIEFILSDAGCRTLLTSTLYKNRFSIPLEEVILDEVWPTLDRYSTEDPKVPSSGDDLIYVLYTSGTTGRPKGVQAKHNGVVNVLLSVQKTPGLKPTDKTVALATISFDLATVEIYLPLLTGAELILVDSAVSRSGQALAGLLQTHAVSFIQATPATLRMLWEGGWRGDKNLTVISCAEALPMDLAQKLMASCRSLWNYYGPTETTIYATGTQILPTDELITIGKPIDNTQVYIADEKLRLLPVGQSGEICIAGVGLAKGYLNQPGLTAEKFIDFQLPDGQTVKLYRTGDLGQFGHEGNIRYQGRIDQQVKIRGHRIEVAEIEHHLLKQVGVKNAVVIAREDTPGDQRLVAYLVPDRYIADEESEIRNWRNGIRRMLPEFMIPNNFVLLAELPVTPNGKIDKKALPKPGQRAQAKQNSQPQTKEEDLVASIWMDVFGLDTINLDDNFFEIGGHSLIAVQVMTRLEEQTGRRLPLSTLFEYPTVRKLAKLVQADQPAKTWKSLVPIKPEGTKTPLYIIHGIGLNLLNFSKLITHIDDDQPVYGLQARGLDGTEEPSDDMETIAAHYNAEILEQNPNGPYAIAGYSFGGYVAYEMARQLKAMGKEVKMLAIFDTDAKALHKHRSKLGLITWKIGRQFPKFIWVCKSFVRRPSQTIGYQAEFFRGKANAILVKLGLSAKPKSTEEPDHLNKIMEMYEVAFHNYVLHPYDGAIDLFRATERLYFVDDYHFLGWREYALRGVRVHDVPGDHRTIMIPPNDKVLAQALQQALNRRQ